MKKYIFIWTLFLLIILKSKNYSQTTQFFNPIIKDSLICFTPSEAILNYKLLEERNEYKLLYLNSDSISSNLLKIIDLHNKIDSARTQIIYNLHLTNNELYKENGKLFKKIKFKNFKISILALSFVGVTTYAILK